MTCAERLVWEAESAIETEAGISLCSKLSCHCRAPACGVPAITRERNGRDRGRLPDMIESFELPAVAVAVSLKNNSLRLGRGVPHRTVF